MGHRDKGHNKANTPFTVRPHDVGLVLLHKREHALVPHKGQRARDRGKADEVVDETVQHDVGQRVLLVDEDFEDLRRRATVPCVGDLQHGRAGVDLGYPDLLHD